MGRSAAELVDRVADPRTRIAFWCTFADVATDAAEVPTAKSAIDRARREAIDYGVAFALPFTAFLEARLHWLRRRFQHAEAAIAEAENLNRGAAAITASSLYVRLLLALARGETQRVDFDEQVRSAKAAIPSVQETHIALLALALMVIEERDEANRLIRPRAADERSGRRDEPRRLRNRPRAVQNDGSTEPLLDAVRGCQDARDCFGLITACRSAPFLLNILCEESSLLPFVRRSLALSNDHALRIVKG